MKRRKFLHIAGALSPAPFVLNSMPLQAFGSLALSASLSCTEVQNRALVIIQMRGGNDGLNTIIPVDAYATYANLRPDIKVPDSGAGAYINLDSTLPIQDQIGIHPSMTGLKSLYDNGMVNVIQGAGYPSHNRSHFKSTDLLLTGGDGTVANFNLADGWMGRYLKYSYDSVIGNPSPAMPDPVGIQLGNKKPSLGFHSTEEHAVSISMSGQDPSGFFTLISEIGLDRISNIPSSDYGKKLEYIEGIEEGTEIYAKRISQVFNNGRNSTAANYPDTYLANQLKTVARLLHGGSKTKIFLVDMAGFDTHVNQVDASSILIGKHAALLAELSDGVKAFQDDLAAMELDDRVLTTTFSEFGRKAHQNASMGTDHGTLGPMMVFGKHLQGGVTGTNLDLTNLVNGASEELQWDYRKVFRNLLRDWLGADDAALTATGFLDYQDSDMDLVQVSQKADTSCPIMPESSGGYGDPNNPNVFDMIIPLAGTTNIANEPLVELTDCNFVDLKKGFVAPVGSNVRIYPSDCTPPPAALNYDNGEEEVVSQSIAPQDAFDEMVEAKEDANEEMGKIVVYPNPCREFVNVSFTVESQESKVNIAIMDSLGKVIDSKMQHSFYKGNYYTMRMDVSGLIAGTYYAVIVTNQQRKAVAFAKV